MSYFNCPNAEVKHSDDCPASIDQVIVPRTKDIGGFEVRRVLPSRERRTIGPFVFFDQMGLGHFRPDQGLDVRPHPHIGLATITYLFSGEIMHRDSLGTKLVIRPGAVNLMTAGRGIVHSERSPDEARAGESELFGLQAWIALPKQHEETEPDFSHHSASELPIIEDGGARARVLSGSAYGQTAPVPVRSETLYVDIELAPGARLPIDSPHEERGLYIADGSIEVEGQSYQAGQLLVLKHGAHFTIGTQTGARVALLGGEPLDGPRHLWWNFVHSDKDRIEQAKADWVAGRFDRVIDDPEWIPLPDQ